MLAVACFKPPTLETCSDSIWYFIGFNAAYLQKGPGMAAKKTPLDATLDGDPYVKESLMLL